MLSPDFLEMLRCPMDPRRQARLAQEENRLVCLRCGLRFSIRDGLPNLVVNEAELPPGCASRDQLACQREAPPATPP
jgi:uncharacterized protein YbaR (Trm112 family)